MFAALQAAIAALKRGFASGSTPCLTATESSFPKRVKILALFAS